MFAPVYVKTTKFLHRKSIVELYSLKILNYRAIVGNLLNTIINFDNITASFDNQLEHFGDF